VSFVPTDAEGREITAQKTENHSFQVGGGGSIPQFDAAVRGLAKGGTAQAEVSYPDDHADPALAGRAVAFVLTLGSVKEKRRPAFDDDFARDLGFEDLNVLRTQARNEVERRLQSESERTLRESLVDSLLQANPFEAPESMVEQAMEHALADYDRTWQRIGMEPDPEHRQEYAKATRPAAERIVKRALALESLSAQHGLVVAEEDVDRWIEDKVLASGSGANDVRAFFTDVRRRRRLRSELSDDKVFEFLKGKAEITEVQRPADPPATA
jgi:trigger factor